MNSREAKALEIAARSRLVFEGGGWTVPSQSGSGTYRVFLGPDKPTCTCDDFLLRQEPCKHIMAARLVLERDGASKAPPIDTDVMPVKKTYRQNWPVYNEAQTTEKNRFQVLLHDLCKGLVDEPQTGRGRKRVPLADQVFASVFKIYCTFSTRRFACDLTAAHAKGYTSRPLHHNSVNKFLEDEALTPILHDLIGVSALPLRAVETVFVPDSSGFSVSRFVRWFDEKYGGERSGRDWVKVHVMAGTKTHIVTAVEIHGRDAGDSPQFKPLLDATAKNFTVKEVPADKAYSSLENVEAVAALGAFPAIAFKSNATGGVGGAFEKLFYFYSFHREEFLKTYHQRSNIESVFSMVKAKFRDNVRSKTDPAMKNEVLCKFLAHNLCCVIMSQIELGIEAVFWKDEEGGEAVVLPLVR